MESEEWLGVAVVAFRSTSTLPLCLASIRVHCPGAAVVVVENSGDLDGVKSIVEAESKLDVQVIDPGGNVGYSRGVNLAVARLVERGCTHLLILNPDVRLTSDPVALLPFLGRAAVVAGVVDSERSVSRTTSSQRIQAGNVKREVTWASSLLQALVGTRFNFIRPIPRGRLVSVPHVDGAYMLQSLDDYARHPFNESFELYFEDAEYCDHAREGRGVAIFGQQVGIHIGGASAKESGGLAYVVNRVSRARYLRTKYPGMPWLVSAVPFAVELAVRTLTRQAEDQATRMEGYRLAIRELRNPGEVTVLK